MTAVRGLGVAAAFSGLPIRAAAQAVDSIGVAVISNARIAVATLHGPIRLSTLTGAPERAILMGNVNGPDWSPSGDRRSMSMTAGGESTL